MRGTDGLEPSFIGPGILSLKGTPRIKIQGKGLGLWAR